jgi:hypothetical protein
MKKAVRVVGVAVLLAVGFSIGFGVKILITPTPAFAGCVSNC